MAKQQGTVAWLVTWEWAGDHARVDEPIAAILSPRFSEERVGAIVEVIYGTHSLTVTELAMYASKRDDNPYRAQWHQGHCQCGHNPWLFARKVDNVRVSRDEATGLETIRWVEKMTYSRDPETGERVQKHGPIAKEHTRRNTGPLRTL